MRTQQDQKVCHWKQNARTKAGRKACNYGSFCCTLYCHRAVTIMAVF